MIDMEGIIIDVEGRSEVKWHVPSVNDHVEVKNTSKLNNGTRRSFDSRQKLKVVKYAEKRNNCEASRKFSISEANIRRWRKDKEKLRNCSSIRRAFRGPKQGRFPQVDQLVQEFVQKNRQDGVRVAKDTICRHARAVASDLNIPPSQFTASTGWAQRFLKRMNLSQRSPKDTDEKYQRRVLRTREHLEGHVGNADETTVSFDVPSKDGTGDEGNRITVMLAALADGTKLPPFVVFRRNPSLDEAVPPGVLLRVQSEGRMTEDLMLEWLDEVWNRRPGYLQRDRGLLILKGHLTEAAKKKVASANTDLVIIPDGMVSRLQVMDVRVNGSFKEYLLAVYADWLSTPVGKLRSPSLTQMCQWVLAAWEKVPKESIVWGFKRCRLLNTMDGAEEDIPYEDSDSDVSLPDSNVTGTDDSDRDDENVPGVNLPLLSEFEVSVKDDGMDSLANGAGETGEFQAKETSNECAMDYLQIKMESEAPDTSASDDGHTDVLHSVPTPAKVQRLDMTLADRIALLDRINGQPPNTSHRQLAELTGVSKSTIQRLIQQQDKLREEWALHEGLQGANQRRKREGKAPDVEEALNQWFTIATGRGVRISGPMLKIKSEELAKVLGYRDFKATNGWLSRWKSRHDIKLKKPNGDKGENVEVANADEGLCDKIPGLLERFSADDIFCVVETGLLYRATPDGSLDYRNQSGCRKDRVTLMCCCNMSGTDRRKMVVVGKSGNLKCLAGIRMDGLPVVYRVEENAWMTPDIFKEWLAGWDAELREKGRKVVLLVADCVAHPRVNTLRNVEVVLQGARSCLNPMVGVTRALKTLYRGKLVNYILDAVEENVLTPGSTAREVGAKISLFQAVQLIADSWREISHQTVLKCFAQCGIRCSDLDAPDGADDTSPGLGLVRNWEEFVRVDDGLQCYEGNEGWDDVEEGEEDRGDFNDKELEPLTSKDARKYLASLRRYFMQEGSEGSPLNALDICDDFIEHQSMRTWMGKSVPRS